MCVCVLQVYVTQYCCKCGHISMHFMHEVSYYCYIQMYVMNIDNSCSVYFVLLTKLSEHNDNNIPFSYINQRSIFYFKCMSKFIQRVNGRNPSFKTQTFY